MKRTELTGENYKGSGIKTLRAIAYLSLILGFAGALAFAPMWNVYVNYHSEINIIGISCSGASVISGFIIQGVCLCLATIAETSLVKTVTHEREILANETAETKCLKIEKEKASVEE